MVDIRIIIRFAVKVIAFCFVLFITGCNEFLDNLLWPKNEVISLYKSPKIDSYKIRSVALLPMTPDDTTDAGTFYSTNHFINSLEEKYPNIKFTVSDIDTAITIDSLAISKTIHSIEKKKKLDLKNFYSSELGYDVIKDSADAIIIGTVDSCSVKNGFYIANYQLYKTRIISCRFTYYLISLRDGRVLWKAHVLGEDGYIYYGIDELHTPLYYAVSNGINLLLDKIPLE